MKKEVLAIKKEKKAKKAKKKESPEEAALLEALETAEKAEAEAAAAAAAEAQAKKVPVPASLSSQLTALLLFTMAFFFSLALGRRWYVPLFCLALSGAFITRLFLPRLRPVLIGAAALCFIPALALIAEAWQSALVFGYPGQVLSLFFWSLLSRWPMILVLCALIRTVPNFLLNRRGRLGAVLLTAAILVCFFYTASHTSAAEALRILAQNVDGFALLLGFLLLDTLLPPPPLLLHPEGSLRQPPADRSIWSAAAREISNQSLAAKPAEDLPLAFWSENPSPQELALADRLLPRLEALRTVHRGWLLADQRFSALFPPEAPPPEESLHFRAAAIYDETMALFFYTFQAGEKEYMAEIDFTNPAQSPEDGASAEQLDSIALAEGLFPPPDCLQ